MVQIPVTLQLNCACCVCVSIADIEVACYAYEGVDAVKKALRCGLDMSTEDMPIKVTLLSACREHRHFSGISRSIQRWGESEQSGTVLGFVLFEKITVFVDLPFGFYKFRTFFSLGKVFSASFSFSVENLDNFSREICPVWKRQHCTKLS